jgi:hypothetical protein
LSAAGALPDAQRLAEPETVEPVHSFRNEEARRPAGLLAFTPRMVYFLALPILNTLVPQVGQVPWVAGFLFFKVTSLGFLISFFARHLTQYASAIAAHLLFGYHNNAFL